jgi:hypothetical protein
MGPLWYEEKDVGSRYVGPGCPKDFCLSFIKSKAIAKAIDNITPELWAMPLPELEKLAKPTEIQWQIKLRLWQLIFWGLADKKTFRPLDIHQGICTYDNLYYYILSRPELMAWVLKPDGWFNNQIRYYQAILMNRMGELIDVDPIKPDGQLNINVANIHFRIFKILSGLHDRNYAK